MDTDELMRKHELITSDVYQKIRKEALDYIVKVSSSGMPSEVVRGMLMLLKELDSWEEIFKQELAKRRGKQ